MVECEWLISADQLIPFTTSPEPTTPFATTPMPFPSLSCSGFCSGCGILTTLSGVLSDGSGISNYMSNSMCEWMIAPELATSLFFSFSTFETESLYDYVTLTECDSVLCHGATLLATLSGNHSGFNVTSSTAILKVTFSSDGSTEAQGWSAAWVATGGTTTAAATTSSFTTSAHTTTPTPAIVNCSGSVTLTDASGSFEDGSGDDMYLNGLDCSWIIAPTGASGPLTLFFPELETETLYDKVEVSECATSACTSPTLLRTFEGVLAPANSFVQSPTGILKVRFSTDGSTAMGGFRALWYASSGSGNCSGTRTETGSHGALSDGSGASDYSSNLACEWIIAPAAPTGPLALVFTSFETEPVFDQVEVLECMSATCTVTLPLQILEGSANGTLISAAAGIVKVRFTTDASNSRAGWTAFWFVSGAFPPMPTPLPSTTPAMLLPTSPLLAPTTAPASILPMGIALTVQPFSGEALLRVGKPAPPAECGALGERIMAEVPAGLTLPLQVPAAPSPPTGTTPSLRLLALQTGQRLRGALQPGLAARSLLPSLPPHTLAVEAPTRRPSASRNLGALCCALPLTLPALPADVLQRDSAPPHALCRPRELCSLLCLQLPSQDCRDA